MIKKLFLAIAALAASMSMAFAQVDVNKADAAALDSVKGVGPAMSKTIIAERAKGEFKDWADFEKRVKGVGEKRAAKLSEAGLQVNGKSKEGAPMAAASGAPSGAASGTKAKTEDKAAKPAKAGKADAHPKAAAS